MQGEVERAGMERGGGGGVVVQGTLQQGEWLLTPEPKPRVFCSTR